MTFTKSVLPSFLAIAGASVLAVLPAANEPAVAASLNLNFPSCSSVSLTDSGSGTYTVNCGTAPTTPGAPTGCFVSTSTASLPSSGGSVTYSATCGGTTASTNWYWSRTPAFGTAPSGAGPHSETLTGNNGATPITYTYQINACNGGACSQASSSVVVAGTGGGPVGGGGGPIACEGYSRTTVVDIPWANTGESGRIATTKFGTFPGDGALVLRLAVPAGYTGAAKLTLYEYGTQPVYRQMNLSQTPCDFGKTNWYVDHWEGTNVGTTILINRPPLPSYANMTAGQVYYFNVRNKYRNGASSCTAYASCDQAIEFAYQ